jgi:hypothetical protein
MFLVTKFDYVNDVLVSLDEIMLSNPSKKWSVYNDNK